MSKIVKLFLAVFVALVVIGGCAALVSGGSNPKASPTANFPKAAAPKATHKAKKKSHTISDGTYLVGTDIKSGHWTTPGGGGSGILNSCYWSRSSDDSGELDSIIANNDFNGPGRITVHKGEVLELSGGCHWKHIG